MKLESPLARARGLGSARQGTHHWWQQRLTAVALAPLSLWFIGSMLTVNGADRAAVAHWLHAPLTATLMLLFVATLLHHAQLGMQVVIEDYVDPEWQKVACILLLRFVALLAGAAAALAIVKIVLGP